MAEGATVLGPVAGGVGRKLGQVCVLLKTVRQRLAASYRFSTGLQRRRAVATSGGRSSPGSAQTW